MVKTLRDKLKYWSPLLLAGTLFSFSAFSIHRDSLVKEEFENRAKNADTMTTIFNGRNSYSLAGFDHDRDGNFDQILHYANGISSSVNIVKPGHPYFETYSDTLKHHKK